MARQIPFAGFVKKLTVGRVIVAVVCGALGFGIGVVKDWSEVKGARFVPPPRGRTEPAGTEGGVWGRAGDTPSSVVDGLFDGIDLWTHKGMNAVGLNYHNRQERRRYMLEHTPVRKVEAIRRTIDGIIGIYHYTRHVEKIEEVQELSAEFGVMRIVTERLL